MTKKDLYAASRPMPEARPAGVSAETWELACRVARRQFEQRGNHTEIHIGEWWLAGTLAGFLTSVDTMRAIKGAGLGVLNPKHVPQREQRLGYWLEGPLRKARAFCDRLVVTRKDHCPSNKRPGEVKDGYANAKFYFFNDKGPHMFSLGVDVTEGYEGKAGRDVSQTACLTLDEAATRALHAFLTERLTKPLEN